MKKMIFLITFILISVNNVNAATFNWKKAASTVDSSSTWYYDKKTVFKVGGFIYFWQLTDYKKIVDGEGSVITHSMVNCDTYEMRWIIVASYSSHMGKGKIVTAVILPEFDKDYFKWDYYDPENTTQGALLKKVCKLI